MSWYVYPKSLEDLLLHELDRHLCRETVDIETGADLELGTLLARVDGEYKPFDPAGATDAAKVVAVLLSNVQGKAGSQKAIIMRRMGVLAVDAIAWPDGITDGQKLAALNDLDAIHILARATL